MLQKQNYYNDTKMQISGMFIYDVEWFIFGMQ